MTLKARRRCSWRTAVLGLAAGAGVLGGVSLGSAGAAAQETWLVAVVGLGGTDEYRNTFHRWALSLRSTALGRMGIGPDRFIYLGERPQEATNVMAGAATKAGVRATLERIARESGPLDRVLLVFLGHGTGQRDEALFNLPGPDLGGGELASMLGILGSRMVAVVGAFPSSGPWVQALAGENRVVITATRSAQERNETQFGGFFVEALGSEGADLDKDGAVSLLEAFEFARQEVERYYRTRNLLATEHPQLEDDGDGRGSVRPGQGESDGRLADSFAVVSPGAQAVGLDSIGDPVLRRLYQERGELERKIRELRALRGAMEQARYEAELEELLVALALKNRQIRERGGGGG